MSQTLCLTDCECLAQGIIASRVQKFAALSAVALISSLDMMTTRLGRLTLKTLKGHLEGKLRDDRFRRLFAEEKQLAQLSLQILQVRQHLGLSQQEVAKKANITQQQLSKLEHGANCNVATFLKVCNALGVSVELETPEFAEDPVV